MRWTSGYVWSKVLILVPYAHDAKMCLPEALKSYAVAAFIRNSTTGSAEHWDDYVVLTALKELQDTGYLEFGLIEEDWLT